MEDSSIFGNLNFFAKGQHWKGRLHRLPYPICALSLYDSGIQLLVLSSPPSYFSVWALPLAPPPLATPLPATARILRHFNNEKDLMSPFTNSRVFISFPKPLSFRRLCLSFVVVLAICLGLPYIISAKHLVVDSPKLGIEEEIYRYTSAHIS